MKRLCVSFTLGFLVALFAGGCGRRDARSGQAPSLRPGETAYQVKGVIREFPVDGRGVVVRHEEIPGYMPPMTMTFTVRDTNGLRGLSVGDSISFRLIATEDDHWIDSLQRLAAAPAGSASPPKPSGPGTRPSMELQTGDKLPEFIFTGEGGATGSLTNFHGRAVAFTFLFTRCPLPDYCPRMSKHFARTRNLLLARTNGPANWQFLSLSFDPEFDRPEVLARYATSYRGTSADRWQFGALAPAALAALAPAVNLMVTAEHGSFLHNLRTVVVDPQGRIYRQFAGNDWTPEELAQAVTDAARIRTP